MRGELVDGGVPLALGSVASRAEILEQRQILGGEHIQIEVVLAGVCIDKTTFQHESTLGTHGTVEVKTLLQMGWQGLEVDLADIDAGEHGGWQFIESAGCSQQEGFGAGRVVQQRTLGVGAGVGDGLLVDDLGAGSATDLR